MCMREYECVCASVNVLHVWVWTCVCAGVLSVNVCKCVHVCAHECVPVDCPGSVWFQVFLHNLLVQGLTTPAESETRNHWNITSIHTQQQLNTSYFFKFRCASLLHYHHNNQSNPHQVNHMEWSITFILSIHQQCHSHTSEFKVCGSNLTCVSLSLSC